MSENILNQETTSAPAEAAAPAQSTETTQASTSDVSFLDSLPEDIRAEASLQSFKDAGSLAKSYVNAQKLIGSSIRIPAEDASPEAKAEFFNKLQGIDGVIVKPTSDEGKQEFFNKLGRPEDKEGYKLQELISDELMQAPGVLEEIDSFKDMAHEIGLNKEQAEALVKMRLQTVEQSQEQYNNKMQESQQILQKLWGQEYDNRLNAAKNVAKIYSEKHPEAMQELINGPAGNNPALLSMLAELGSNFKEKGHQGMQQAKFGVSPEDAINKIAEKRADIGFMKAYGDDRHPGHKQAVKELTKLYEIAQG